MLSQKSELDNCRNKIEKKIFLYILLKETAYKHKTIVLFGWCLVSEKKLFLKVSLSLNKK